jgi:hypothetical protein
MCNDEAQQIFKQAHGLLDLWHAGRFSTADDASSEHYYTDYYESDEDMWGETKQQAPNTEGKGPGLTPNNPMFPREFREPTAVGSKVPRTPRQPRESRIPRQPRMPRIPRNHNLETVHLPMTAPILSLPPPSTPTNTHNILTPISTMTSVTFAHSVTIPPTTNPPTTPPITPPGPPPSTTG